MLTSPSPINIVVRVGVSSGTRVEADLGPVLVTVSGSVAMWRGWRLAPASILWLTTITMAIQQVIYIFTLNAQQFKNLFFNSKTHSGHHNCCVLTVFYAPINLDLLPYVIILGCESGGVSPADAQDQA